MSIEIVIVEDNTMLRENLELMLGGKPDFSVSSSFSSSEEALEQLKCISYNLLLADI